MAPSLAFPPGAFRRENEEDDRLFYASPRRVVHLDAPAIDALSGLYGLLVPARACVLDLMASWRSHLPPSFAGTIIGLGLNRQEMQENPGLREAVVQDLNREPTLPFNDAAFDAAVCAVSVQYLTRPVDVFQEVRRTLKPDGLFIVSFSNRCFPEKAVALWRAANDSQHVALVVRYFDASGGLGGAWSQVSEYAHTPPAGDPLYAVWAARRP
jgi:SAM-dependent methyltransferase